FTKNAEIPMAKSIMDYIFKWLAIKFLARDAQEEAGVIKREDPAPPPNVVPLTSRDRDFVTSLASPTPIVLPPRDPAAPNVSKPGTTFLYQQDAPSCSDCGSIMVRNGACYKCLNCGSTSGCS